MSRGAFRAAALAIVLVAGALRVAALDAGLPHLMTRPDEESIVFQTSKPAHGIWDLEWAVYPHAYVYLCWGWSVAGVWLEQRLGLAPAGAYEPILHREPARILLLDRVLSAVAGTATVAVVIGVARAALGDGPALVAGALLATSFLHARDSHAAKPDAMLALGAALVLAALVPLARRATLGRGALAGAAAGFAMAMKYPGVLLLAPVYVAAVAGVPGRGWRRVVPGAAVVAGLTAAAVFVGTSPFLVFNPKTRAAVLGIVHVVLPQVYTTLPPDAPKVMGYAVEQYRTWWRGFIYHAVFSLRFGAGLLATLAAPLAVGWALVARRALPVAAAVFVVLYYVTIGISPAMLARYMTPLLPVLALLEAGAAAALVARLVPARRGAAALALVTICLAAEPTYRIVAWDRLAARTDTRLLATEWIAGHVPAGARVGIAGTHYWGWGAPQMPPGVIPIGVPDQPAALEAARVPWLVTHEHTLPYSGVDPATFAAWAPHLRLLADFDPFVPGRAGDAVFEQSDAYYIPLAGFSAVTRPGPQVRVYAVE